MLNTITQFVVKNDVADTYLQTQKSSGYMVKWGKKQVIKLCMNVKIN